MKILLIVIPVVSLIFALVNGRISEMSAGILDKSGEAVELVISLCGIMCFWCGIMRVAERAGLMEKLAKLLKPIVNFLFKSTKNNAKATALITANLAANILGLGNASTPLGITAMRELSNGSDSASDDMILLAVMNTASLQIIPTTAAALRAANGVSKPLDILPCVWIVSVYAAAIAIISAKVMGKLSRKRDRNE
ncbi:MAG: spore maturation protein A [Oscillospiraceae bacterium]|nr:spore maturation protein A [Oscillospiraceae bacterium]